LGTAERRGMMSGTHLGQLLLATSVLAGAAGHTVLKQIVGSLPGASSLLVASYILRVDVLPRLLLAFLLLALSFGAWLGALRHLELSYSYAMASASIVVVALLAAAFLGETIAPKAWLGLVLIIVGCVLITPADAGTTS
jgi:drug/metabolite transporter (DMT)-like permease